MAELKEHMKNQGSFKVEDSMLVEKTESIIERVSSHKGVDGVIICDKNGAVIQTTMDNTNTAMYAEGVRHSAYLAKSMVRDVDPNNELCFIRIGTKKLEMMAHLDPDYIAIIIQTRIRNNGDDTSQYN